MCAGNDFGRWPLSPSPIWMKPDDGFRASNPRRPSAARDPEQTVRAIESAPESERSVDMSVGPSPYCVSKIGRYKA
jgi:hypothetical protein